MPIIHQGYGGGASIDFNAVASRPVIAGGVEQKVCEGEGCGRQFFRSTELPREHRQRLCALCVKRELELRAKQLPEKKKLRHYPVRLAGNTKGTR